MATNFTVSIGLPEIPESSVPICGESTNSMAAITEKLMIIANTKAPKNEIRLTNTEIFEETSIQLETQTEEDEDIILYFAEEPPRFVGGEIGLKKYIRNHLKYPTYAKENDIQGKLYVRFLINKAGNVEQIKTINTVHPLLDKEAIRIVKSLPQWIPGKQNGKTINVWYTIPINFVLQ